MRSYKDMEQYRVKTVQYNEDGPGQYTVMMVRFDPRGNPAMSDAGYRNGVYVMYLVLGGGVRHATTDQYGLASQVASRDDDTFLKLLNAAQQESGWQKLTDGEQYRPADVRREFP